MFKKIKVVFLLGVFIMSSLAIPTPAHAVSYGGEVDFESRSNLIKDELDLILLGEELEEFVANHPNSTDLEKNNYLREFVKSGGLNQARHNTVLPSGIGDYVPGYKDLNAKERQLALENPVNATKVYFAAKKALDETKRLYGHSGWMDNSDAFRHCLWNALMKKSIGVTQAERWATAHEYESSGIDKEMDLYNNKIGRQINVGPLSEQHIIIAARSRVKDGTCRRVVNGRLVTTNGNGMKW